MPTAPGRDWRAPGLFYQLVGSLSSPAAVRIVAVPRAAATTPPPAARDTAVRILDAAEALAQTRGFNGFSYADIAAQVGITRASLHYHFPAKADLGRALMERYTEAFREALRSIDADHRSAAARLESYVALYADVLRGGRMCLCGMLAAEYSTLPAPVQSAIRAFFDLNEAWLASVLERGQQQRTLDFGEPPREVARFLLGALEGAMLVSRTYADPAGFERSARVLVGELRARG